ncbi:Mss4-like protein [Ilyonectria destructans]|nr:Mss4-like protein [Ilyonectria destructans]
MADEVIDKTGSFFPQAGLAQDGWSTKEEATATCYCGTVQLSFPLSKPGFVVAFVCHCSDCRKITASMFTSGFVILDTYLKHVRGEENLKQFSQSQTIEQKGNLMTNFFCSTCGSLMYRRGAGLLGASILRIGTVDDFKLGETALRPTIEQYVKHRVDWIKDIEDMVQMEGQASVEKIVGQASV